MNDNNRESLAKILSFIKNTSWNNLDESLKQQAQKCFLDLTGVICAGAKNNSSKKAALYVSQNFGGVQQATILATGHKTSLIGAALGNGMAANALDMDDGYSLLRGHPGSGFFGALLSAAEFSDCSYGEFLAALVVAYELSIRQGFVVRDFYKWDHSTGCYSAFGTAASIGKLLRLDDDQFESALSIADFMAPLNPSKRSCFVPSMNKDGIYYGNHVGAQAVMMAKSGITGRNPVILDNEYKSYIDSIGKKYYIFDLYFKFYSCCRWAQGSISSVSDLMTANLIEPDDISNIDIFSFGASGTLYKGAPTNEDEAQYNIKYPIAAQVIFGECGPIESSTTKMLDPRIKTMINKINFHHDPKYDNEFPAKRLSRSKITLNDGKVYESKAYQPRGDKGIEVTFDEIKEKIFKMNKIYNSESDLNHLIDIIMNTSKEEPFVTILDVIKNVAISNEHPQIKFI